MHSNANQTNSNKEKTGSQIRKLPADWIVERRQGCCGVDVNSDNLKDFFVRLRVSRMILHPPAIVYSID